MMPETIGRRSFSARVAGAILGSVYALLNTPPASAYFNPLPVRIDISRATPSLSFNAGGGFFTAGANIYGEAPFLDLIAVRNDNAPSPLSNVSVLGTYDPRYVILQGLKEFSDFEGPTSSALWQLEIINRREGLFRLRYPKDIPRQQKARVAVGYRAKSPIQWSPKPDRRIFPSYAPEVKHTVSLENYEGRGTPDHVRSSVVLHTEFPHPTYFHYWIGPNDNLTLLRVRPDGVKERQELAHLHLAPSIPYSLYQGNKLYLGRLDLYLPGDKDGADPPLGASEKILNFATGQFFFRQGIQNQVKPARQGDAVPDYENRLQIPLLMPANPFRRARMPHVEIFVDNESVQSNPWEERNLVVRLWENVFSNLFKEAPAFEFWTPPEQPLELRIDTGERMLYHTFSSDANGEWGSVPQPSRDNVHRLHIDANGIPIYNERAVK